MNLSKREKVLLYGLLLLLAVAALVQFVVRPLNAKMDEERAHLASLSQEKMQMEIAINNKTAEKEYRRAKRRAEQSYDSFYSTLNTYTIDNILNGLMSDYGLHIQNLEISPYAPVSESDLLPESASSASSSEGEQTENFLLLSTVELLATGSYENALAFVDALNAKSFCLRVDHMQIDFGVENEYRDEVRVAATVLIYGIDMPTGAEQLT